MKQKLYLMKNDFGIYKIGVSINPEKRACNISCNSGVPTHLLQTWELPDARYTECQLHEIYKEFRTVGEWFTLTDETLVELDKTIQEWSQTRKPRNFAKDPKHKVVCSYCVKEFKAVRSNAIYCSGSCRVMACRWTKDKKAKRHTDVA